ncbi:NUDIX hydrolase [Poriferisphaera sp. WC338]|uniref:NUDIX hydrolase n=1 Tax=Poriferisphaera sp. WC338 TaxID=3425129 RepID=UPI003D817254
MTDSRSQVQYQGKYLHLVQRDEWEYVTRPNINGIVCIIPVLPDGRIIFTEQYRPPVKAHVVEFPAGLSGDVDSNESLQSAAERELLEETGYTVSEWQYLFSGPTSPGLTDEIITLFLATKLQKVHEGGGVENESIITHKIPQTSVSDWLKKCAEEGLLIDTKIWAGLYALKQSSDLIRL